MEEIVYIYGLVDPNTNEIKYIGQTNCLRKRLDVHLRNCNSNGLKDTWIRELKEKLQKPKIEVLSKTTKFYANDLEDSYIKKYSETSHIFNKVYNKNLKQNKLKTNNNKEKRRTLDKYTKKIQNLTSRETQIAELICSGFEYIDIANNLFISRDTVKHHMQSIRYKFNLTGHNNKTWVIKLLLILLKENILLLDDLTKNIDGII